jgi:GNAT superfamily N-acetyltransferase
VDDATEIHRESTITDSSGTVYRLHHVEYSILSDWDIFDGEYRIGFAHCLKDGSILTLGDIKLEATFVKPAGQWERWARKLLGLQHYPKNYRKRGLGSALLKVIIHWAKENGFTQIKGSISNVDTPHNPKLVEWYNRLGFTFSKYSTNGRFVGEITLNL